MAKVAEESNFPAVSNVHRTQWRGQATPLGPCLTWPIIAGAPLGFFVDTQCYGAVNDFDRGHSRSLSPQTVTLAPRNIESAAIRNGRRQWDAFDWAFP